MDSSLETLPGPGIKVTEFDKFPIIFPIDDKIPGVKIGEIGTMIFRKTYTTASLEETLPGNCNGDSKRYSAVYKFEAGQGNSRKYPGQPISGKFL